MTLVFVLGFLLVALASTVTLTWLGRALPARRPATPDQINALLPQTQCGKCTYTGCKPYATAIFSGEADINQCPPGGQQTILELSRLLGVRPIPLDPRYGLESDNTVAKIQEDICIGCTLCIKACPVDAIVGATKLMHTVIERECTGCELCIPPCPVDCIDMIPESKNIANWKYSPPSFDGYLSRQGPTP